MHTLATRRAACARACEQRFKTRACAKRFGQGTRMHKGIWVLRRAVHNDAQLTTRPAEHEGGIGETAVGWGGGQAIKIYAVLSPVISLIKKLISVITLIRLIEFRPSAYIWIAEDADYVAESITLPEIIPNRRNGRERCPGADCSASQLACRERRAITHHSRLFRWLGMILASVIDSAT